jgi:hypothetical protein
MNSTRQATRITLLGASAVLALTWTTACGSGTAVERDRAPNIPVDASVNEEQTTPSCASALGPVVLRRSPPQVCGGHPTHPTWAEYRLEQEAR